MYKKKTLLCSLLALTSIASVALAAKQFLTKDTINAEAAVGNYSADADTYYSGFDFSKKGKQLLGPLHDLITTTHKNYVSYDDSGANGYQKTTDAYYTNSGTGNKVSGYIFEFYSQAKWVATWDGGDTYNREHLWCQSLSNNLWGTSGGGADMHHIRPVESGLNSSRGNNYMVKFLQEQLHMQKKPTVTNLP